MYKSPWRRARNATAEHTIEVLTVAITDDVNIPWGVTETELIQTELYGGKAVVYMN